MVDLITTTHVLAQSHPQDQDDQEEENRKKLITSKKAECYNQCYIYGGVTGVASFSAAFFLQKYFSRAWKNRSFVPIVLSSVFFSGFSAYLIVNEKKKECDKAFSYMRTNPLKNAVNK